MYIRASICTESVNISINIVSKQSEYWKNKNTPHTYKTSKELGIILI